MHIPKVAREFADQVIETPEQGISHAKNIGYSNAQGTVCAFMDADSVAEEHLFEEVFRSIVQGYNGGKAKIRPLDDKRLRAKMFCWCSEALSRYWRRLGSGAGAFTFLTRELGRRIENPNGPLYREYLMVMEDFDLLIRMKEAGNCKLITESCLYTSMRRFIEEGYLKCLIEDYICALRPDGKTRERWNGKL